MTTYRVYCKEFGKKRFRNMTDVYVIDLNGDAVNSEGGGSDANVIAEMNARRPEYSDVKVVVSGDRKREVIYKETVAGPDFSEMIGRTVSSVGWGSVRKVVPFDNIITRAGHEWVEFQILSTGVICRDYGVTELGIIYHDALKEVK